MTAMEQTTDGKNAMRKLLMVSHTFPPTGGSGVQRSVKFAKYLPDFGWQPVVWASDHAKGLPVDESLQADIPPGVRVVRTNSDPRIQRMTHTLRGVTNARSLGGIGRIAARFTTAMDWRLAAYRDAQAFPDDCAPWAKESAAPALELIETECVDALYSTYSPVSNHTLAMELKHATSLPWVADFRDLWTDDPRYRESSPKRRAKARHLEQQILETADVVIAVTPMQRDILASRVAGCNAKFVTITNGYDPADFADVGACAETQTDRFVLAHVGRLDVARTRPAFFEALASLRERLGEQRGRFVLRVVGHCNGETQAKLESTGITVEVVGYVSHADAIAEMLRAGALLALLPTGRNAESIICGKLFEYLATGNPILVVGPKGGECERIVKACDAGIATTFDSGEIAKAIVKLFVGAEAKEPICGCDARRLHPYSRIETTRQLADVLSALVPIAKQVGANRAREVASI